MNQQDEGRINPAENDPGPGFRHSLSARGPSELARQEEEYAASPERAALQAEQDWREGDAFGSDYIVEEVMREGENERATAAALDQYGPYDGVAARRKGLPLYSGVLNYFPDALLAVAELSRIGNDQHNPGQPLHWARDKSTDHADALARHLLDQGDYDTDGVRHTAKVAWRALALLQTEIEAETPQPLWPEPTFELFVNLPVTDTEGKVYDFRETALDNVEVRDEAHGRALMDDLATSPYLGRIVSLWFDHKLVANVRRVPAEQEEA